MALSTLVDLVLGFTLCEAALLTVWRHTTGRGPALREFLPNMVSGLALMLALRCAVRDTEIAWIALWLLAAGLAHAADLAWRWRRARVDNPGHLTHEVLQ